MTIIQHVLNIMYLTSDYGSCLSPYNVVTGDDSVDLLRVDAKSYRDLTKSLALAKLIQQEQELEEERLCQKLVYLFFF